MNENDKIYIEHHNQNYTNWIEELEADIQRTKRLVFEVKALKEELLKKRGEASSDTSCSQIDL